MSSKTKAPKKERKYSTVSSLAWAIKNLWKIDKRFVFFIFANVPISLVSPLITSYLSKYMIDSIGMGEPFSEIAWIVVAFVMTTLMLNILNNFMHMYCYRLRY